MAASDEVTISAQSEHTTALARSMKEYSAAYEKWKLASEEADYHLRKSEEKSNEADRLKVTVEDLRTKLKELMNG